MLNVTVATTCRHCAVHTGIMFWLVPLCRGSAYHFTTPLVQQPISQIILKSSWMGSWAVLCCLAGEATGYYHAEEIQIRWRGFAPAEIVCSFLSQVALNRRRQFKEIKPAGSAMRHTCEIENILALCLPKPDWGNCRLGHVELKLG